MDKIRDMKTCCASGGWLDALYKQFSNALDTMSEQDKALLREALLKNMLLKMECPTKVLQ